MSKAQPTAEHWEVVSTGRCPLGVGRRTGSGTSYEMLCNPILKGKGPHDLQEINRVMTLMAAAPKLLAACNLVVETFSPKNLPNLSPHEQRLRDVCSAAISQATSEASDA